MMKSTCKPTPWFCTLAMAIFSKTFPSCCISQLSLHKTCKEMAICLENSEADGSRKSAGSPPPLRKPPIFLLIYNSVDIALLFSLMECLSKNRCSWCFEKCSCIKRGVSFDYQGYLHFNLNDFITNLWIMYHIHYLHLTIIYIRESFFIDDSQISNLITEIHMD